MKAWAAYLVGPYRGNPLRIGYFSDNEIGWWNGTLYAFYVQKPAGNHTKQRLVALLREHYGGDWRRFTDDFVVENLGSFDELLRRRGACAHAASGQRGDSGGAAVDGTGRRAHYYRLVHDALRAADPEALILGDRLPIYYDPGRRGGDERPTWTSFRSTTTSTARTVGSRTISSTGSASWRASQC